MTDSEDKFSEKHSGKAFSVFDEEIIAYISKQYKHLKRSGARGGGVVGRILRKSRRRR